MQYFNIGIVFLMGIAGIWKSIPAGFVLGLDPIWIGIATIPGALLGVYILYALGSRVKKYFIRRNEEKAPSKKWNRVVRLFDDYGTIGLGLIGTLVVGPPMTMALGLMVVKSERKLWVWTSIGTVVWSCVLTVVGAFSVELLQKIAIFN